MKTKMILLLIALCVLFQKGRTQWSAGTEQYYSAVEQQSVSMVQVEWYQKDKLYVEGRHNYEAPNSFSLYMGRSYEKKAAFSYFVCPMAAIVWGGLTGGSVGLNTDVSYKKISFNMQAQYTFSISDRSENYLYSWSEFGYQIGRKVNVGILTQHTKPLCLKASVKSGFYAKFQFGNLIFPLYIFDLNSNTRSVVLGINFQKDDSKE